MWTTRRLAALASTVSAGTAICLGLVGPATFPAARFAGFAESGVTSGSRLVVLDDAGLAHDIEAYKAFQCSDYQRKGPDECGIRLIGHHAQLDIERTAALEARLGPIEAGVPVQVVRRRWTVTDDDVETTDCPVATCEAVPR